MKKFTKKIARIKKIPSADVGACGGQSWAYTDIVKDHFFHPRNLLLDDSDYHADGVGMVGSPACGDMMLVWIKVAREVKRKNNTKNLAQKRIVECKWRTFGCASAIASTSMMSVMATEKGGMTLAQAKHLKPQHILARLGGLPDRKFHCSVLGQEALHDAIRDYDQRQNGNAEKKFSKK